VLKFIGGVSSYKGDKRQAYSVPLRDPEKLRYWRLEIKSRRKGENVNFVDFKIYTKAKNPQCC
jgi:hypothetical protein